MSERMDRVVAPCASIQGEVVVPGDKSISHRVAMFAALADGQSVIRGFLRSEDCLNTLRAVGALGAGVTDDGERIGIRGVNGRFSQPDGVLDMGNSGTGIRLMTGLLAAQPLVAELTGDESLRSRPMDRIAEPLRRMGARIEMLGGQGRRAPIRVEGGPLTGIEYRMPVASAQVKACVLMAGLFARGVTRVIEPAPTRDHTERMLEAMGLPVSVEGASVSVRGSFGGLPHVPAREWNVPGDFSSAAFWLAAAASRPGAALTLHNVGLNSRRTALLDVLRRMGAVIETTRTAGPDGAAEWEPVGEILVRGARLRGTRVGGAEIANLIDELPVVAVLGALADGETTIADAAELRVKESDRIAAMTASLRAMGVTVEERPDGMVIKGGTNPPDGGGTVDSQGDHRIVMATVVLALACRRPATIRNVACVATSYPSFWEHLASVRRD